MSDVRINLDAPVLKERRYPIADCMVGQCQVILSNKLS